MIIFVLNPKLCYTVSLPFPLPCSLVYIPFHAAHPYPAFDRNSMFICSSFLRSEASEEAKDTHVTSLLTLNTTPPSQCRYFTTYRTRDGSSRNKTETRW